MKNALDHPAEEWSDKPSLIISCGFHGGVQAAVQLRQVVEGMRIRPMPTSPALTLTQDMIVDGTRIRDPGHASAAEAPILRKAIEKLSSLLSQV